MKETVYGFYPPARDVWKKHLDEPDSYIKECLYRHRNTRFSSNPTSGKRTTTIGGPLARHPQTDHEILRPTPPHVGDDEPEASIDGLGHRRDQRLHSGHRRQSARTEDHIGDNDDRQQFQVAKREAAEQRLDGTESSGRGEADGRTRWTRKSTGRLAETVYTDYSGQPKTTENSFSGGVTVSSHTTLNQPIEVNRPQVRDDAVSRDDVGHGNKAAVRITFSTEQIRSPSVPPTNAVAVLPSAAATRRSKSVVPSGEFKEKIDGQRSIKSATVCSKSQSITVGDMVDNPASHTRDAEDTSVVNYPVNYNEQLKKYGWRMEVPGDPCHLKRQCLPDRRPMSVVCAIPTVLPPPPRIGDLESSETFFYNTIPGQPMSYTVHPDWASERIVAHRIKLLQKRSASAAPTGKARYPYCTRDFSFIY